MAKPKGSKDRPHKKRNDAINTILEVLIGLCL